MRHAVLSTLALRDSPLQTTDRAAVDRRFAEETEDAVDIDGPIDLLVAEAILRARRRQPERATL